MSSLLSLSILFLIFELVYSDSIVNDRSIWCVTLHETRNILSSNIYPYICDKYHYKHLSISAATNQLNIIWPSTTLCFDETISCKLRHQTLNNVSIGESILYQFSRWSVYVPNTISVPLHGNSIISATTILTTYQSSSQCIQILNGTFPQSISIEHYFVNGYLLRSDSFEKVIDMESEWQNMNGTNERKMIKISTSSHMENNFVEFDQMFCFADNPLPNDRFLHISLKFSNVHSLNYLIIDTMNYTETMHFKLASNDSTDSFLNIAFVQNLKSENGENINRDDEILRASETLSAYSYWFLICISGIALFVILIVSFLSFTLYPYGDAINYFAVIWIVLELFDFYSDISFTLYLFIIYSYYSDSIFFLFLFCFSALCVILPYLLNIFYFLHLCNLWNDDENLCCHKAQKWLNNKWNYAYFLFVCLISGGPFPAIELANSMLLPCSLFAMGVPYFELVRVRTERFITNVCFENLPFLLLQILFYFNPILTFDTNNFVFFGTVISSFLSVLFNATYYFSYKGNISLPIAMYQMNLNFECPNDGIKQYWQHSIWRMQNALSKAFQASSPTLIVIDSCLINEQNDKMDIFMRLLYDESPFGNKVRIKMLLQNKNNRYVTKDLSDLFNKEFGTTNMRLTNCKITSFDDGQLMYDYSQSLIKEICCYLCNQDKNGSEMMSRQSTTRALLRRHTEKRKIKNLSGMKAAYKKSTDSDLITSKYSPKIKAIKNRLFRKKNDTLTQMTRLHTHSRSTYDKALPPMAGSNSDESESEQEEEFNKTYDKALPPMISKKEPSIGTIKEEEETECNEETLQK